LHTERLAQGTQELYDALFVLAGEHQQARVRHASSISSVAVSDAKYSLSASSCSTSSALNLMPMPCSPAGSSCLPSTIQRTSPWISMGRWVGTSRISCTDAP